MTRIAVTKRVFGIRTVVVRPGWRSWSQICAIVSNYKEKNDVTYRELGRASGLHPTTVSRMARRKVSEKYARHRTVISVLTALGYEVNVNA